MVPELVTVASRCVVVDFPPVRARRAGGLARGGGGGTDLAVAVTDSSGGNPERARVMVDDPDVAARVALWASVPDELPARARRRPA